MDKPAAAKPIRRRFVKARWTLAVTAAAAVAILVAGNIHVTAQSAYAASTLEELAGVAITYSDPTPAAGEYLLATTRATWPTHTANGDVIKRSDEDLIQVYQPVDPTQPWVLVRDWGSGQASPQEGDQVISGDGHVETIRDLDGSFYGSPWLQQDPAGIPTGTGAEVLAHFDSQYTGGSASRDEDNFVRISDLLRSGLIPADLRARLFEALALIPGVTATSGVANLDGVEGIAIGRTEWLRGGMRQEIIIDPATGMVIGDRGVSTLALFGWGFNETMWLTAITTTVAPTAP
jgi:RNA polymerase sigma-70 factor (ECF subfamily)